MARIFTFIMPLTLLFCTSCIGLVLHIGERVDLNEDCDNKGYSNDYCLNEPDKIKASFHGEPKRKYFKDNKEYWIYERKTGRGVLIGAILPLPLYFPWTTDTIFEFENGKRIHTSTVKTKNPGFLCGLIVGLEYTRWTCLAGNEYFLGQ